MGSNLEEIVKQATEINGRDLLKMLKAKTQHDGMGSNLNGLAQRAKMLNVESLEECRPEDEED